MALHVAAVEVSRQPEGTWDALKEQNINSQLISTAQFPNLRKAEVNWENAMRKPLFKDFVQNLIAKGSKRLIWLKYQYPLVCENTENWPTPPSNLNRIGYFGDGGGVLHLQKLLIGTVEKLTELRYIIYKKDSGVLEFTLEDCRNLSGIVQHYSKT